MDLNAKLTACKLQYCLQYTFSYSINKRLACFLLNESAKDFLGCCTRENVGT